MKEVIEKVIPDKDYEGMAAIDFEDWRPVYERLWDKMGIYR